MQEFTITIPGQRMPTTTTARILTFNDARPALYCELRGPEEAFDIQAGNRWDTVQVVRPELVDIERYQTVQI